MLATRIIPCLDIREGRVVKGVNFSGLRDAGCPIDLVTRYVEQGADEIVVLDISATPTGKETAKDVIRSLRSLSPIPITVGGGIRTVEDARKLLEAGADKICVNSAAVSNPRLITELADAFGSQCTVLSVDASQNGTGWDVKTHSGSTTHQLDAIEWCRKGARLGAGEILLTSWDRDGTESGYALDLIEAVRGAVTIPIVASGGASSAQHLIDAIRVGADAVLAATIFHDGKPPFERSKKNF